MMALRFINIILFIEPHGDTFPFSWVQIVLVVGNGCNDRRCCMSPRSFCFASLSESIKKLTRQSSNKFNTSKDGENVRNQQTSECSVCILKILYPDSNSFLDYSHERGDNVSANTWFFKNCHKMFLHQTPCNCSN